MTSAGLAGRRFPTAHHAFATRAALRWQLSADPPRRTAHPG